AFNKNHASTAPHKIDPQNGQITGEDRTARVTDVETYSLIVQGQYNASQEFFGPASDDTAAHYEMLRRIQRDGEVELADLPNDPVNKVTLNTINALMIGYCLESNLITETGYMLPVTLKGKGDEPGVIQR